MFKRILVAVDPDQPRTLHAFPAASLLAHACGAELIVGSVVPDTTAIMRSEWSGIGYRNLGDVLRSKLISITEELFERPVRVEIAGGSVASGVLAIAEDVGADLIVLASHQPGPKDHLLTAHGARIARRASCSVLVVRSPAISSDQAPSPSP